ncbi:hypothetical protein GCK72_018380 [Caenorhabditis remanei]|uniref:DUF19 domain-containing protein n=1 Tax=Caenorhabditis remanei TaxID=31234 RepID=A0A6A5GAJ7_CAERE|nr:hypothetical protein GCK72_018380 [Caenorhabditis remanei]KAF1751826.1 hypothetical protein GCK72_018380 [Caenorhabditis remanei]
MRRLSVVSLFVFALIELSYGTTTNRDAMMTVVTEKLGLTFYTASELTVIAKCCEPQFYKTPNNNTAVLSTAKSCILNNSGNKAVQALSLYSNANNCLSPDSLDSVVTALVPPIQNLTATLVKKIKKTLADCKSTNTQAAAAKQETCIQKTYGIAKAAITLTYVDDTCKKVVNRNVSKGWWACGLKYIPSVLTISKYACSKIVKA